VLIAARVLEVFGDVYFGKVRQMMPTQRYVTMWNIF